MGNKKNQITVRDRVLRRLQEAFVPLTARQIAEDLRVSRKAVFAALKKLRGLAMMKVRDGARGPEATAYIVRWK